jgi:glycosyltransferase involved in cell wall biosynthesis
MSSKTNVTDISEVEKDLPLVHKIVVCIPAYNEEKSIASVIVRARKYSDNIIVCDDGSEDMTGEIASSLGALVIRHERNMGKGAALRDMLELAKSYEASAVVTIDADMQHNPDEIPKVAKPVLEGEADIVIGSRKMDGNAPKSRIFGNRLLDEITSAKAGKEIRDTQSGFRAYSKRAMDMLSFKARGMAIESQTLIDASRLGLRITSVAVSTTYYGVKRKRNPVSQFSSVLDYIASRTVVESPFLYLGIPGLVLIILGIIAGIRVVNIFLLTHLIAVGTGLIAVGLVIVGTIMLATSVILKFMKVLSEKE